MKKALALESLFVKSADLGIAVMQLGGGFLVAQDASDCPLVGGPRMVVHEVRPILLNVTKFSTFSAF